MKTWIVVWLIFYSVAAFSALPPKGLSPWAKSTNKVTDTSVKMALGLPFKNRIEVLKSWPKTRAVQKLSQMAFDPKNSLQVRWRAVTSIGHLDHKSPALVKALQSRQWFMRNAAVIAVKRAPREFLVPWLKKLLQDPALVVRTSSVQLIKERRLVELEADLWAQMKSSSNFRKGQSLWIRSYMAQALASFAKKGQEPKFIGWLKEKDQRLHGAAITGLEKVTRAQRGGETLEGQRSAWMKWGAQNFTSRQ